MSDPVKTKDEILVTIPSHQVGGETESSSDSEEDEEARARRDGEVVFSSVHPIPGLFRSGIRVLLYCLRYRCAVLWCSVCPLKWCFRLSEYCGYAKRPNVLRREIRRDLNTLALRMARRYAALPSRGLIAGFRAFEPDAGLHDYSLCKRSHACMRDIGKFVSANLWATEFDQECFRMGWSAGVKSGFRIDRADMVDTQA